jgi:hypothetical protein
MMDWVKLFGITLYSFVFLMTVLAGYLIMMGAQPAVVPVLQEMAAPTAPPTIEWGARSPARLVRP